MDNFFVIIIIILVLLIVYYVYIHNKLIKLYNNVNEAFATLDVYLKKRWDLIPNLVEIVKGYAKNEKETLEEIVSIRNTIYDDLNQSNKIATNEQINKSINKIIALVESYPELKANKNFLELSSKLSSIEDEIAQSRKYYNAVVKIYNNNVEMFPNNIIAKLDNHQKKLMFEAKEFEKENIKVDL